MKTAPGNSVLAFGDVNVDLVVDLPGDLSSGHPEAVLFSGGTIGNTAAGIARLKQAVSFCGKVGNDGYGKFVKTEFEKEGVETSFLFKDEDDFTLMVLAFIDGAGEKHNITWPVSGGAQFHLEIENIPAGIWENIGWFHTSGIILGENPARKTTLKLMEEARKRNIPVSFDLNLRLEYFGWRKGVKQAVLDAIDLSDFIFASLEEELFPLTGQQVTDNAFSTLHHPGLVIIARQGSDDAIVFDGSTTLAIPPYRVDVVDTLGAGDAFNSGFITARMNGKPIPDAVNMGHACAGYNLGRKGARGLPTPEELDIFLSTAQKQHHP